MEWQIRAATPSDAEGLARCMVSAYAGYQGRLGGARLPPMDVDYAVEIQNYPTWVVVLAGSIVGGLIMTLESGEASIVNIAVDPQQQGKGIGAALMRFAESTAKNNNYSELHLATHVLLTENISLYQHFGWQETERDQNRVYMKKKL